jgi:hypothetical protein
MRLALVAGAVCLASTVVYATEASTPVADPPATSSTDGDDEVVCRRIKDVGSNLKKTKVCMTRAEWAKVTDNSRRVKSDSENGAVFTPDGQLIGPVGNTN